MVAGARRKEEPMRTPVVHDRGHQRKILRNNAEATKPPAAQCKFVARDT